MASKTFSGPNALSLFASEMRRLALQIQDGETKIAREAALAIHPLLVLDTAVDRGEARSNWVVTLGGPFPNKIGPYAPGRHLGKRERANADVAIAQGAAVIAQRPSQVPIFITNLAEHIGLLNEGGVNLRPENAPANPAFIENAIEDGLHSAGVRNVNFINP